MALFTCTIHIFERYYLLTVLHPIKLQNGSAHGDHLHKHMEYTYIHAPPIANTGIIITVIIMGYDASLLHE